MSILPSAARHLSGGTSPIGSAFHSCEGNLCHMRRPATQTASMHWQSSLGGGLCCKTEEEYEAGYAQGIEEATRWWVAAGRQGCSWAVDNLLTLGTGPEAERARSVSQEVERDCPHLIGHDKPTGMPIIGPDFMREVTRRLYGVVRSVNE